MATNDVTARIGIKDSKIDIRIGISRMEEAAKTDRIRGLPNLENAIDVNQVIKKAAVLVPTLAGANGTQDGNQRREIGVDVLELSAKERASGG